MTAKPFGREYINKVDIPKHGVVEVNDSEDTISCECIEDSKIADCIDKDICVNCGGDAVEFTDTVSRERYLSSGFCEGCQDNVDIEEYDEDEYIESLSDLYDEGENI